MPDRIGIKQGRPVYYDRRVRWATAMLCAGLAWSLVTMWADELISDVRLREFFKVSGVAAPLLFLPIYLWYVYMPARGPKFVENGTLPCPNCLHPLFDTDADTVTCPECGVRDEYRAIRRAWRKIGRDYR